MFMKLGTLLVALCLMFTALIPAGCLAEEQAPQKTILTWDGPISDMFVSSGLEGRFMAYESLGLLMMIPSQFTQMELTEEDAANHLLDVYADENGTPCISIVQDFPSDEITFESLEQLESVMRSNNPDALYQQCVINGLDVMIYGREDLDMMCALLLLTDGELLQIICRNTSTYSQLYSFVFASLQAM